MWRVPPVLAMLLFAAPVGVLKADVESGPKAGEKVGELKVFAVTGAIENKEVDYAAERKDAPTVYVFVNAEKFSRPAARFMKELDKRLEDAGKQAAAIAIWVGGDVDKNKEYLPRVNKSLSFDKTALTVFSGDASGPNGWGVNSDAHLTVVVARGGKVVKSFGFVSVNEIDVKGVLDELNRVTKK
jgi:hypothetical protein